MLGLLQVCPGTHLSQTQLPRVGPRHQNDIDLGPKTWRWSGVTRPFRAMAHESAFLLPAPDYRSRILLVLCFFLGSCCVFWAVTLGVPGGFHFKVRDVCLGTWLRTDFTVMCRHFSYQGQLQASRRRAPHSGPAWVRKTSLFCLF